MARETGENMLRCKTVVRRLFPAFVLLAAGFIGGLLLTGRLHISNDFLAEEIKAPVDGTTRPSSGTTAATAAPAPVTSGLAAPGPDFTRIAGLAVKAVANISSLQVSRTPNSP